MDNLLASEQHTSMCLNSSRGKALENFQSFFRAVQGGVILRFSKQLKNWIHDMGKISQVVDIDATDIWYHEKNLNDTVLGIMYKTVQYSAINLPQGTIC